MSCRRSSPARVVLLAAAFALAGCGGGDEKGGGATPTPAAGPGVQVWNAQGCGSCHTLAAADATGQTGPDLDEALKGKSTAFIRKSIVDPNAEIAPGFSADVMPKDFAQKLSNDELQQLVDFIAKSAGG
ncbi:MAG: c-type cytochrome [Solirubrobacteraceae bacterium]